MPAVLLILMAVVFADVAGCCFADLVGCCCADFGG